jgi:hypothetical protein
VNDVDDVTAAETKHWRKSIDGEGVCWLTLDKAAARANTLSRDVLEELGALLSELERSPPRALVIKSGKPSGFILTTLLGIGVSCYVEITGADPEFGCRSWTRDCSMPTNARSFKPRKCGSSLTSCTSPEAFCIFRKRS